MKVSVLRYQHSTKLFLVTIFVLISILLASCHNSSNREEKVDLKENIKTDTAAILYAQNFEIINYDNYKIISVKTEDKKWNYCLYTDVKPLVKSANLSFIKLPITKAIALSSTHLGMLEKLNLTDNLVGISDDKYLCSEKVRAKHITNVGDIGIGNFENYLAQSPDLLMHSGFDMNAPVLKQLSQTEIATFANYDWKETHPLGRAEWIKVIGALFNREKEATAYFNQEVLRYESLKDLAKKAIEQPKIIAGSVWGDFWNAPAGESYMAQLFEDANLDYLYKNQKGVGSLQLQFEALIADQGDVPHWINAPGSTIKEIEDNNTKYTHFEAFKTRNLYSYSANQNCFWEKSAVAPHKILADFITLFHPELVDDKTLYFYNRIDK